MKKILILMLALLCFTACNKDDMNGYKDVEITYFDGTWYSDSCTLIISASDENLVITTDEHEATCDFGLNTDKNALSITYGEDENGEEILTEDDYENGYFCPFVVVNDNSVKIKNLPYFRNTVIQFHK